MANLEHIVVIAMFAIALLIYALIDRLRVIRKERSASLDIHRENDVLSKALNPSEEDISPSSSILSSNSGDLLNSADSSKKESMFRLFNDLSIEQIEDDVDKIKNYFEKNFSINLAACQEGWELINDLIDCPEKREKMYGILENTIIKTQRLHFLTKTGRLECKVFKTEKKSVELSFPHIKEIKFKEYYVN